MEEDQGVAPVVKKKRKAWWIVGGVLGFVALLFVSAFLIEWNSPDARMERAVAQIVDDYGLVPDDYLNREMNSTGGNYRIVVYCARSIDAETEDEIVARLRAACPSWEYSSPADSKYFYPAWDVLVSWYEDYSFISPEWDRGSVVGVYFAPSVNEDMIRDPNNEVHLGLLKQERPSMWQRIKGLWPW